MTLGQIRYNALHCVSEAIALVITQSLIWGSPIAVKKRNVGRNLFLGAGPKIFLQEFIFPKEF